MTPDEFEIDGCEVVPVDRTVRAAATVLVLVGFAVAAGSVAGTPAAPRPTVGPSGPYQVGPAAVLEITPNPAHPGDVVTLDGRNSTTPNGSIATCEFDVDGDGTYDAERQTCVLERTYEASGEYAVGLRVTTTTDRQSTATETLVVRPNDPPIAEIGVDPSAPAVDETVTFSGADSVDGDGSVERYRWEFPDGGATGEEVTWTFDAAGEYDVTLTVTDDDGASASATQTVAVGRNRSPTARLAVTTAEPTVGQTVRLDAGESTDPEGALVAYRWDLDGDGTVDRTTDEPTTAFTPDAVGDRTVVVTVVDDGEATDTAAVAFAVAPAATAPTDEATPTAEPTESATEGGDGLPGDGSDGGTGLVPFAPDLLVWVVLLALVGGVGVAARRRAALVERAGRLRDLLTRGDVRRRIARKLSGMTLKNLAKRAIRRLSDMIESGGEGVGEGLERSGRAVKRSSKRVADWLRRVGG